MQADAEMEQKDGKGNRPLDRAIALGSVEVKPSFMCLTRSSMDHINFRKGGKCVSPAWC